MRLAVALLLVLNACTPKPPAEPPAAPPAAPEAAPAAPAQPTTPAAADGAWVDEAVKEALEWEVMPGTEGEPDDGTRAVALKTFFQAHPEYADAAKREALAAEACGLGGTEEAHKWLTQPPAREPVVVEVTGEDWKVFVAHASQNCTSDDWSYYSSEANVAATARGAVTAYGGAKNDVLIIKRGAEELKRIPLTGQGFLAVKAGAEPRDIGYNPEFVGPLDEVFGPAPASP